MDDPTHKEAHIAPPSPLQKQPNKRVATTAKQVEKLINRRKKAYYNYFKNKDSKFDGKQYKKHPNHQSQHTQQKN